MMAILIVALVVGWTNLRRVHDTSDAVAQTYSVKVALQQLLTTMLDAETGERGFIITNAPSYLEPYNRARETISTEVSRVRALSAGSREQQTDLDRLSALTEVKLQELAEAIRQRRELGFASAQAQVWTNVGNRTMDAIRATVARMEAREDALLAGRTAQAAESYRSALWTTVVTSGLGLLAVVALFVGTMRYGALRLRAARAAEAQQAALREALHQKDDFVALVSHELRTPTNTIVGWGRMLVDGTLRPERVEHAATAIARSADSLGQLIDDLMDMSQLASGRMSLSIGAVDVKNVLQDAIDTVRLSAENKGVVLTDAIEPDLPLIRGDAARLKQVVWNLLANAIKFTPAGGSVTVALTSFGGGLRLEVHDTGEGIDSAFLPHVFERYRQAASARSHRGIGLGLAIVRYVVELHGGQVTAHSAGLGHGATFVVELPMTPVLQATSAKSHIEQA